MTGSQEMSGGSRRPFETILILALMAAMTALFAWLVWGPF